MNQPDEKPMWGDIRFQRRGRSVDPSEDAWTRFRLGAVLALIAVLVYPWYSYKVQAYLLANDVKDAAVQLGAEVASENHKLNHQLRQEAADDAAWSREQRLMSVHIKGVSSISGQPVVIVDFGQAGSAESTTSVCNQVNAWLRRDMRGQPIRLQQYRGDRPAIDAGSITCR